MIAKEYRFHGHGSLRYVYKNGEIIRTDKFIFKYTENKRRKHSRFAVVVGKKVLKSAVGRNRIRRRIYEALRAEVDTIKSPHDIVVIVFSSEIRHQEFGEIQAAIREALSKSGIQTSSKK